MEICMTAKEFVANSISRYNRCREDAKDSTILYINLALKEFSGKDAKVTVPLACPHNFRNLCGNATEWRDIVDEIQKELVQKGFHSTWELLPNTMWMGKLTVEVSNND